MNNFISKACYYVVKKHWVFIIIFLLGLSISWPLFRSGYFSHQDDLHVIRIFEMRKCLVDLQIPCRWVPDMGWGNGYPLFNFYGVSTYYLGAVISFVVGYLLSAKILFFVVLVIGGFGMYLLVNELWGKYAGLLSAVLYMFAPYKALDVYVRGALVEAMALTIIPFVFFLLYKKKYLYFVISLFLFLITHNIMTIVFLLPLLLWSLYVLYLDNFKNLKNIVLAFAIAFGMSSFFILPAFFEKDLVQTESLTRFELDYRANFIGIKQLFLDRVWGYGTSIPGPEGGMNFQIGWPHWVLVLLSAFLILFSKSKKYILPATLYLLLSVFSIFMTHNKSTFIWERISILTFFQFPWRFLSLSIFTSSILGGFVVSIFQGKYQKYLVIVLVALTVLLNWNYFRPREFYNVSDKEKLAGNSWEEQRRGAMLDYLPKTALEPREGAPKSPLIITGEAETNNYIVKSNNFKFDVKVLTKAQIDVPVFYFPNWEVKVNGKVYPSNHDNLLGRISITLDKGEYKVEGKFKNTAIRNFANAVSLISFVGLILLWKKLKK